MVGRTQHAAVGGTTSTVPEGQWWAWSGIVAGLAGIGGAVATAGLEVGDPEAGRDAARVVELSAGKGPVIAVISASFVVAAFAAVVFGAGLRRRLAAEGGSGVAPDLALAGLVLVAALCLVGSAPATDVAANLGAASSLDPDAVVANSSSLFTTTWVWAGTALSAAAVALGGLGGSRAVPRWLATASAMFAVLIATVAILPLQYLAVLLGALWLLLAGVGMLTARRARAAS
jgi:hypothetical protein